MAAGTVLADLDRAAALAGIVAVVLLVGVGAAVVRVVLTLSGPSRGPDATSAQPPRIDPTGEAGRSVR